MAILCHSSSPIAKPSPQPQRPAGFVAGAPKSQPFPLLNNFSKTLSSSSPPTPLAPKDSVFTLPNWRSGRNDHRTRELKLNDAFLYLEYMVGKGHKPDVSNATQLMYDLCKCSKARKASRVMELMVNSGTKPDPASYTFLVNHLCRRGNVGHAMQIVGIMEEHGYPTNTMIYNSLVRGICMRGNLNKTLQFVERLMQKGLVPNAFTYSILLEAAYKEKGVDEAIKLLDDILEKGGNPNLVSYNVILTGLCKEGRVEEAMGLFRALPGKGFCPNVVSYNILLRSLCYEGRWEEANELLAEMDGEDRSPSIVTYNILIGSLAEHGLTDQALEVLDELFQAGRFDPDAASYNPVLARLCREKRVDDVLKCLDEMCLRKCSPNEGTYNAIAFLCDEGMVKEAFSIIESLRAKQDLPTGDYYRNVISSLCRKGNTYPAFRLLYEMTVCCGGYTPDSYTYSSLIRGLCLERMLGAAMGVFRAMEENGWCWPDVDNYNALVLGLCKCSRTDLSVEVLEMMVEKGYVPNETTYTILVEGIIHEEEKELGAEVLTELHLRRAVGRSTVERLTMQYDLHGGTAHYAM
ncbi:hypothetical protein CASFOL_014001 [Castilleja foliolosa]|uniref:Pentatricopeptide repeat-containing protein n=1 Tax=Castilleja foliolosa TaxID=1961234 RepID=A0ABD3DNC1_9LAMI